MFGLSLAPAMTANSQEGAVQYQCGPMSGYGYYLEEGAVTEGAGGWTDERIRDGAFIVTVGIAEDGSSIDVDYRYKDASGRWYDPTDEGGRTRFMNSDDDGSIQIAVEYPASASIELITFSKPSDDGVTALYVATRNGLLFNSAKIMTAKCTIN